MPTVLRAGPYRLHFYAADGSEPRHIHVARHGADAKFWLDPDIRLAHNHGYNAAELRQIKKIVAQNVQILRDAWDDNFNP
jgi:hypothetical protein